MPKALYQPALALIIGFAVMIPAGGYILNQQPPATQMIEFHPWWMDPHPEMRCVADPPMAEVVGTGRATVITCAKRNAFEMVVSPLGEGDRWIKTDPYAFDVPDATPRRELG